jgi:hypothetical protein
MGWGFIFTLWALSLGFQLQDPLFGVLHLSGGVARSIEVLYLIGTYAYLGRSMVLIAKILLDRPAPR